MMRNLNGDCHLGTESESKRKVVVGRFAAWKDVKDARRGKKRSRGKLNLYFYTTNGMESTSATTEQKEKQNPLVL
jgi:hypothetical protein